MWFSIWLYLLLLGIISQDKVPNLFFLFIDLPILLQQNSVSDILDKIKKKSKHLETIKGRLDGLVLVYM